MKKRTIKTQKLVFYHLTDTNKPFLIFEISGSERDVDEATFRIRNEVLRMQNGIWDETQV